VHQGGYRSRCISETHRSTWFALAKKKPLFTRKDHEGGNNKHGPDSLSAAPPLTGRRWRIYREGERKCKARIAACVVPENLGAQLLLTTRTGERELRDLKDLLRSEALLVTRNRSIIEAGKAT